MVQNGYMGIQVEETSMIAQVDYDALSHQLCLLGVGGKADTTAGGGMVSTDSRAVGRGSSKRPNPIGVSSGL